MLVKSACLRKNAYNWLSKNVPIWSPAWVLLCSTIIYLRASLQWLSYKYYQLLISFHFNISKRRIETGYVYCHGHKTRRFRVLIDEKILAEFTGCRDRNLLKLTKRIRCRVFCHKLVRKREEKKSSIFLAFILEWMSIVWTMYTFSKIFKSM